MRIMIIDSGGRGDALAWAVRQDPRVRKVFCVPVSGYEKNDFECFTFSAGLARNQENELVTSGGRVIHLVGRGKTLEEARKMAYGDIEKIRFDGMYFRKDIGLIARS